MSSKADADVYVLSGASQQGDMPKSGFSVNSPPKVRRQTYEESEGWYTGITTDMLSA